MYAAAAAKPEEMTSSLCALIASRCLEEDITNHTYLYIYRFAEIVSNLKIILLLAFIHPASLSLSLSLSYFPFFPPLMMMVMMKEKEREREKKQNKKKVSK